jgi:hypothetical protein
MTSAQPRTVKPVQKVIEVYKGPAKKHKMMYAKHSKLQHTLARIGVTSKEPNRALFPRLLFVTRHAVTAPEGCLQL